MYEEIQELLWMKYYNVRNSLLFLENDFKGISNRFESPWLSTFYRPLTRADSDGITCHRLVSAGFTFNVFNSKKLSPILSRSWCGCLSRSCHLWRGWVPSTYSCLPLPAVIPSSTSLSGFFPFTLEHPRMLTVAPLRFLPMVSIYQLTIFRTNWPPALALETSVTFGSYSFFVISIWLKTKPSDIQWDGHNRRWCSVQILTSVVSSALA